MSNVEIFNKINYKYKLPYINYDNIYITVSDLNLKQSNNNSEYDVYRLINRELSKFNATPIPVKTDINSLQNLKHNTDCIVLNMYEYVCDYSILDTSTQKILDYYKVKYTGNDHLASYLTTDKSITHDICSYHNIATPKYIHYDGSDSSILSDIDFYPVIVKPTVADGSDGISKKSVVHTKSDLIKVIDNLINIKYTDILIEQYIDGIELHNSVISTKYNDVVPLNPTQVKLDDMKSNVVTGDIKFNKNSAGYLNRPYQIYNSDSRIVSNIMSISKDVFKAFMCRDYIRCDFRLSKSNNRLYLIDVNVNPDLSMFDSFDTALTFSGISRLEFINMLLDNARYRNDK